MTEEQAIPAATVIVMREAEQGPPELLMVERAAAMSFAGGALVFPGGRVDPGDFALAALHAGDVDENAARIGAIRETLEEAGVAVGLAPAGDMLALRDRLYAGEAMGELLDEAGAALDLDALVPFSRWLPAGVHHKVFDTRFYLARAPKGAEPLVDGNENVRVFWASARAVLDAADRGEAHIIFPTRRNLDRLAQYASFDAAVADARAHPIRTVTPWIEERDGERRLCIPDDLGYPITSQRLEDAVRI
ncbi:8-oxo-dGTP pyrophosphatase MutT (NUDIX family) [Sphingomonas kyeonggiensis]|uniref:8-oxo-dGTP pyrophosphatase MutT (NUDIX family) n=1 Tax=Sphingomonas kyeonggiensis TaxID=1268553 RepID=A0A7W7NUS6_9SPHN|nr:NUDIX domain-containing protein [Sphingomonas kyeonggiensis]MBB4841129.1 8-oxo-dGTP pyrophosphatase MutT (NUDIX family) [Sphingomonas kyeonggiensis]